MSENNDASSESNSLGSDSILQSSRLTGGGLANARFNVLRPSVLGQSVLGSSAQINNASDGGDKVAETKPTEVTTTNNPFMKDQKTDDEECNEAAEAAADVETEKSKTNEDTTDKIDDTEEEPDERPDPLTMLRKNGLERANLFAAAKSSIPLVEKSGFVFGQNVHERVVVENINLENTTNLENSDGASSTASEMLFSSVIEKAAKSSESDGAAAKETESKTLTDVAREYEQSRVQKRKYEEVETFTGEENEMNIVEINCKLFAFINSNWEERGRGSLRLNDSKNGQECSRVVFRTSGNLRLLLNTKVWAGMVVERPSQKSLRLTAMDNTGKIKVFLAMARPLEISQLYKALEERIKARKTLHPEECFAVGTENSSNGSNNGAFSVTETNEKTSSTNEPDDITEPTTKKPVFPSN